MTNSLTLCASAMAVAAAQAANAQEKTSSKYVDGGSIVVTAQFREQSALEVPIAITAYDGAFLDRIGLDEFDELSRFVPGFVVQEQNVNNSGFVLRGITSDNGASNIEPRVSVFQNGVSIARARGSNVQLFDLERIEVLKGPQGTLFGRSAQTGAVHIITRRPTENFEGYLRAEAGNYDQQRYEGAVNIPLMENISALRVAGVYERRAGFIDNNTGRDLNGKDSFAIRGSFRFEPTQAFTLDLIGHYNRDTPPGTAFKSGIIPAFGGSVDPNEFASLNTFGNFLGGESLSVDRELWDVALIANWRVNDAIALTSTTAYREFDSLEIADHDGSAFEILIFAEDAESRQFSSDLRVNIDNGGKLTGVFGGGAFLEEGSQSFRLGFDIGSTAALFSSLNVVDRPTDGVSVFGGSTALAQAFLTGNPAVLNAVLTANGIPGGVFQEEMFTNFADNLSLDLFGELSYDLTDRLTATIGGRFTYDDKETAYLGEITRPNPLTPFIFFGLPTIFTGESGGIVSSDDFDIDNTFSGFTWRAVLNYEIADGDYVYFNYSRGRRPQVINEEATNNAGVASVDFQIVDAEIVNSYEIGFKGSFLDTLATVETAVFYYDYQNFQIEIQGSDPGQPLDIETINAGLADSIGAEIGVSVRPRDGLDVFFTYGLNRTRFDKTDRAGVPQAFGGNRFRLAPDHSLSAGFHYETDIGGKVFFITPTYTWQSKIFFESENIEEFAVIDPLTGDTLYNVPTVGQESYGLINIRGGVRFLDGRLTLEGYVENLADREFIIDAGNIGGAFNIPTYSGGPPRFFGAGVNIQF